MEGEQPVGRARGRGRGLFQHPPSHHGKDGHPGPQREPWIGPNQGPARPPLSQSGRNVLGLKHSSSEDSQTKGRGGAKLPATSTGSDPTKTVHYPGQRDDNKRGTIRTTRPMPDSFIVSRPPQIDSKVGTTGQKITCEANYFRLKKRPEWNIYLYHVDFQPDVASERFRRYLVATQREMLGGFLFDGTQLFVVRQLEAPDVIRTAKGTTDDTVYTLKFSLTKIVSMNEQQSVQVLNLILRRAMDGLQLQTIGRNKYDAAAAVRVQNLRLDIWPGYITSIRQHEEDILVCAEISHKIMRSETVLDILKRIRTEDRDFKTSAQQVLLGTTVLTKYNNKTYRIDEITFDIKPRDTFKMREEDVSYIDYYKKKYNIEIRDQNQPMLLSNLKEKDRRGGLSEVLLVPELCYATGLTEEMRSNFKTMRDMAQYTKVAPAGRIDRLLKFNQRLNQTPASSQHLADWSLGLEPELVKIPARILPYPKILFGNNKTVQTNVRADWQSEFRNNSMAHCVELKRWYIITPSRCRKEAEDFVKALQRAGSGMRFNIGNPRIEELSTDTQTAISSKIGELANQNPQLIMCVVSNNQGDRYATIKKRCYLDYGLPSQVMVAKTITPKDKTKGISGLLSVATKVAIQMNAKLGGLPWLIEVPISGLMTVGYDVCHDPKNKKYSWGAMVATMDLKNQNNEFFSAVNRHESGEELSNFLGFQIVAAVKQFQEINGALPAKIMFFRDGVGDGQIRYVLENELVNIKKALKEVYERLGQGEPPFLYMIVTKRINTRIFFDRKNPDPGTCVDDIITLPERYDFFLIPQSVREGTVTPTGFNVIHDTFGLPPDRLQMLTFRFTYFYFNWSGTVRVPALCQYAHKLAFIASQSMQAAPTGDSARKIERTLYFL